MNAEFAENALKPVEPERVWPMYDLGVSVKKLFDPYAAQSVLGYAPVNRKDRRKAGKLLRSKKY
jgi:hypothetical protein